MDNNTLKSYLTMLGHGLIEAVRESECHTSHLFQENLFYDSARNKFYYVIEDVTRFWFIDRRIPIVEISCSIDDIAAGKQIPVDFLYSRFATTKAQQLVLDCRLVAEIRFEPRWGGLE